MTKSIELHDHHDTRALGEKLAKTLGHTPCIIFLVGELGAGKTTLAQGFISALVKHEAILSPTYAYMHSYQGHVPIYHFDLFRIEQKEELVSLGLLHSLEDEHAIRLIEWPKLLNDLIKPTLIIELKKAHPKRQAMLATSFDCLTSQIVDARRNV